MDLFNSLARAALGNPAAAAILRRPNAKQRAWMREQKQRADAVAAARAQWLNALMVDETSGWLSLYQQRPDVLRGLTVVLSLAALAKAHDDGNTDSPEVRIVRGAISAVEQCGKDGSVLTQEVVKALSSAANMARGVITSCSNAAIEAACVHLHSMVRQPGA